MTPNDPAGSLPVSTVPAGHSIRSFLGTRAGAHVVFALITVLGLLVLVLAPKIKRTLGIIDFDFWFLDSYAVLAASDAARAGIDTDASNPLDLLHRPHSYTDWWHGLGKLGFTRKDNFLIGGSWVAAFLLMAWATARPRRLADALCFAAIVLSPPVLLAINRANNDLVVFALVGLGLLLLQGDGRWRIVAAVIAIAVATGLKFYPAAAAFVFVLLRPTRRLLVACGLAAVVIGAVLVSVLPALHRGIFAVPSAVYTMGGVVLLRDLGLERGGVLLTVAIVGLAAAWIARRGVTARLADEDGDDWPRLLFAAGAALLVACFLAGASFAYRWIFALWLAPWLLVGARSAVLVRGRRRMMRATLALLITILWIDGVYCVVTNVAIGPMPASKLDHDQRLLRLWTQPLTWILMILLTGWIFAAVWQRVRELWSAPPTGSPN